MWCDRCKKPHEVRAQTSHLELPSLKTSVTLGAHVRTQKSGGFSCHLNEKYSAQQRGALLSKGRGDVTGGISYSGCVNTSECYCENRS